MARRFRDWSFTKRRERKEAMSRGLQSFNLTLGQLRDERVKSLLDAAIDAGYIKDAIYTDGPGDNGVDFLIVDHAAREYPLQIKGHQGYVGKHRIKYPNVPAIVVNLQTPISAIWEQLKCIPVLKGKGCPIS